MRGRPVASVLALVAAFACESAAAQPSAKTYRIGWLGPGSGPAATAEARSDFALGLSDAGYTDRNLQVVYRYADGNLDRLPELAADLVRQKVDLIVTSGSPAAFAAKRATGSIPIVATEFGVDPVKSGLVASLARPGGNVTGLAAISEELWEKRLQLLRQVVPKLTRVLVLWNPANPGNEACLVELQAAARPLGVQVHPVSVRDGRSLERALADLGREPAEALVACWDHVTLEHARAIADFALRRRLVAVMPLREYVDAGSLLSFGTNLAAHRRRAAHYVDRVLKGAKPAELPVERPTHFELVVNAKTAEGLGVTLPGALLLLADDLVDPPPARR